MWLATLVLLVPLAESAAKQQRNSEFKKIPHQLKAEVDGNLKLVFANVIWRHGDRAPEQELPGGVDKLQESNWTFGGGGYGELSPLGMSMHFNLGRNKLRPRYMDTLLSPIYNSRQIYVRSTDYNRTLISAYSNLAGMYSNFPDNRPGIDLPDGLDGWPTGFVPIPVHTVEDDTDFVGNTEPACGRLDQLENLVITSDAYVNYANSPQVKQTLEYLSNYTNSNVTMDNVHHIWDTIYCESQHMGDIGGGANIEDWYPWYFAGNISQMVASIVDMDNNFVDGAENPDGIQGVNVSVEIPRIKTGSTFQMISTLMHGVLACYKANQLGSGDACGEPYDKLVYFVLSAHDTTVDAYLNALGAKKALVPEGYPLYSAAVLTELWIDQTTNQSYIQFLYHDDPDEGFRPFSPYVYGCPIDSFFCPLETYEALVSLYDPGDANQLCATDVFANGNTTSTAAVTSTIAPTTPTVATTTKKASIASLYSALFLLFLVW